MTGSRHWSEADYVVIDVEGNGARPPELVELGVVAVSGGVIGPVRSWLVRPSAPITWQARAIHGISDADVAGAPVFDDIAGEVSDVLGDAIPVGHNVGVDLGVMRRALPGWRPAAAVDTLRLARRAWSLPSYRLGALVEHRQLDTDLPAHLRPHRAGYDALVTARLMVDLATTGAPGGVPAAALLRDAGAAGADRDEQPALFDL